MNAQVTDYIEKTGKQKEIMETVRRLIHETVPDVEEAIKWGRPVFKSAKNFAYLKAGKAYVTLGFFNHEKLNDPGNLLQGTGKDMRHIKLKTTTDIDSVLLKEWFTEASV